MAEFVQWDSIRKSSNSSEKTGFLRLESGKTYKIRPIFSPVRFYKYFHKKDGKLRTAICSNPDTCPVRDNHPELKKPVMRFAAYVIDRADGQVKILEAPQSVFRPIGNSFEMTGKNPGGGKDGSDWFIKVTGKGLNTTYDVGYIKSSPLTQEEREAIKEAMEGDKDKLKKIYKVDSPEEIEKKLFGDLEEDTSGDALGTNVSQDNDSEEVEGKILENSENDDSDEDDFDQNW